MENIYCKLSILSNDRVHKRLKSLYKVVPSIQNYNKHKHSLTTIIIPFEHKCTLHAVE